MRSNDILFSTSNDGYSWYDKSDENNSIFIKHKLKKVFFFGRTNLKLFGKVPFHVDLLQIIFIRARKWRTFDLGF